MGALAGAGGGKGRGRAGGGGRWGGTKRASAGLAEGWRCHILSCSGVDADAHGLRDVLGDQVAGAESTNGFDEVGGTEVLLGALFDAGHEGAKKGLQRNKLSVSCSSNVAKDNFSMVANFELFSNAGRKATEK